MTTYTEITLRYAKEDSGEKLRGLAGTIDADLVTGGLTIWSPTGTALTVEPEHFDGFLDALMEIKTHRQGRKVA